jgi:hypothetical protein
MLINLIPVCDSGVSYGSGVLIQALTWYSPYLLRFVVICDTDPFAFKGKEPTPQSILKANITAAIALFREPGTIGQVTGFIQENGLNINLSGTGGAHGKEVMECLSECSIQPQFCSAQKVAEAMSRLAGKGGEFQLSNLSLFLRLEYWKRFLIEEIAPQLYTDVGGNWFGKKVSGTWQRSWDAEPSEIVDDDK